MATSAMHVMDGTGDTKLVWDEDKPVEVEAARTMWDKLVTGKGYAAFSVKKNGDQGERIRAFDPAAEKIILVAPIAGG